MNDYGAPASPRPTIPAPRMPMPQPPEPSARLRGTVTDLINRAAASGEPRLVRAAEKVQDLIRDLDKQVSEYEHGAELRAEAERLKARLAEINGQLGKRTAGDAGSAPNDKEANRAIRQWAAANGVACPPRGRIPATVRTAYKEARS